MPPSLKVLCLTLAACLLAACGSATAPATDLLSHIQQRGTLITSAGTNYAPQSVLKQGGARPAGSQCPADTLTTGELEGFDVDVAAELARRLGVEICFATPTWDLVTAGSWGGRWDISVGSMTITPARMKVLSFTTPYYYAPAQMAAARDSGLTSLGDLAGKNVCAGSATTYEAWLNHDIASLGLPQQSIYAQPPANITVVPLDTDQECAEAIAAGRRDFSAYLTSSTLVDRNIEQGVPVVKLGAAVFAEELAVAIDKAGSLSPDTLVGQLDAAVKAMHADGTLGRLSVKWFGEDLTKRPG
ncbi:MAG: transporter substrate-binding domain-containing protein [Anaerolineales bacterium]